MSIIDVIKEKVELVKLPNGKYKGRCPFCQGESLFVYPNQESWHCFMCGKGGDGLSFGGLIKNVLP